MSRSFSVKPRLLAPGLNVPLNLKDPRVLVRAGLGLLVIANIAAALVVFRPWGGSAEDLARERADLQQQLSSMQGRLEKTKALNQALTSLNRVHSATLDALSMALDFRDQSTSGHSRRVAKLTAGVASSMGIKDAALVFRSRTDRLCLLPKSVR